MSWLDFDLSVFDDADEMTEAEYDDAILELGECLSGPEWEVLDDLQIFMETAGYGAAAEFFFSDDSGEDRFEEFYIPSREYEQDTLDMARRSNSENAYKRLYKSYISKKAGLL